MEKELVLIFPLILKRHQVKDGSAPHGQDLHMKWFMQVTLIKGEFLLKE